MRRCPEKTAATLPTWPTVAAGAARKVPLQHEACLLHLPSPANLPREQCHYFGPRPACSDGDIEGRNSTPQRGKQMNHPTNTLFHLMLRECE